MIQKIEAGHEYLIFVPTSSEITPTTELDLAEQFSLAGATLRRLYVIHGSGAPLVLDVTPPAEPELKLGDYVRMTAKDGTPGTHEGVIASFDRGPTGMVILDTADGARCSLSRAYWNIERA